MIGDIQEITEQKKTEEDQFLINELDSALKQGKSLQEIIELTSIHTKKMFSGLGAAVYLIDKSNTYIELQNPAITSVFVKKVEKLLNIKIPNIKIPMDSDHFYLNLIQKKEILYANSPAKVQQVIADFGRTMEFGGKAFSKITKKMMPQIYKILNLKSIYTIPLISEEEVIGILDMSSHSHFSDSDLDMKIIMPDIPYYDMLGNTLAINKADLFDGTINIGINYDENKNLVTGHVWTGMDNYGVPTTDDCDLWTKNLYDYYGTSGTVGSTTEWLESLTEYGDGIPSHCNSERRIYCYKHSV